MRGERTIIKVCDEDEAIELLKEDPKQIELFPTREIEGVIAGIAPDEDEGVNSSGEVVRGGLA